MDFDYWEHQRDRLDDGPPPVPSLPSSARRIIAPAAVPQSTSAASMAYVHHHHQHQQQFMLMRGGRRRQQATTKGSGGGTETSATQSQYEQQQQQRHHARAAFVLGEKEHEELESIKALRTCHYDDIGHDSDVAASPSYRAVQQFQDNDDGTCHARLGQQQCGGVVIEVEEEVQQHPHHQQRHAVRQAAALMQQHQQPPPLLHRRKVVVLNKYMDRNSNNNTRMSSAAAAAHDPSTVFCSMPTSYCSPTSSSPYQIRDATSTAAAGASSSSSLLSTATGASVVTHQHQKQRHDHRSKQHEQQQQDCDAAATCAVCGDGPAKLHYGVLACYGCKGFFRRTLSGKYHYICRFDNDCIVDKYQRNSCRCCRFKRCLEVGMDPNAVRPDRDLTGKQRVPRLRKRAALDEELINHMVRLQGNDWTRKIPVEARMLLMQLLNIESKVARGDCAMENRRPFGTVFGGGITQPTTTTAQQQKHYHNRHYHQQQQPPLPSDLTTTGLSPAATAYNAGGANETTTTATTTTNRELLSLRELFEQKPSLNTRRTEMCYEPYRMAQAEELPKIAHRGAIAAVDWVESLAELFDTLLLDTQDKISLVKACYAPLTIFNFSARTAQNTRNPDILCLCSYSYVPRKLPPDFNGSNHLSNNLIDRTLNELVAPLRRLALREEEVVPLKAIIILDPNARNLSPEAQRGMTQLRDRVQDMLFHVVKELHPVHNAAQRFGNLLLLLPTISTLSGVMCENMQFCQVFGWTDPLLNELFETTDMDKCYGSNMSAAAGAEEGGGGTHLLSPSSSADCLFTATTMLPTCASSLMMSNSPPMLLFGNNGTSDATTINNGTPTAATATPTAMTPSTLCNPADISLHVQYSPMFQTVPTHAPASTASSSTSVPHSPVSDSSSSLSASSSSCSASTRQMVVEQQQQQMSMISSSRCHHPQLLLRCEMSTQTEGGGDGGGVHGPCIGSGDTPSSSSATITTTPLALSSSYPPHDQQQFDNQQHLHQQQEQHRQQDIVVSPSPAEHDDDHSGPMLSPPLGVLFDDAELDSLCRDHNGQPVSFDPLLFENAAISAASSTCCAVDDHHHHQIDDEDLFRLMQ